jgi:hypothetical protein
MPVDCVSCYGAFPSLASLKDLKPDVAASSDYLVSVPCSVSCEAKTATLIPLEDLEYEHWHTAMVSTEVRDLAGNQLEQPYWLSFMTAAEDAPPPHGVKIVISNYRDAYLGQYAYVDIVLENDSSEIELGYFDFVVGYDASVITFVGAEFGDDLEACWEYFTYRYNFPAESCESSPTGLIRTIGIADLNNGDIHPDPSCTIFPTGSSAELVNLVFRVTDDSTYACTRQPIRFTWLDCNYNVLSPNSLDDPLWFSQRVYDHDSMLVPPFREVTGDSLFGGHWWIDTCRHNDPEEPASATLVDYYHGGIDIFCPAPADYRGDLNLNNVVPEIADAVLYANYFIFGIGVFDIYAEAQIANSETNCDGEVLTIADLVYLARMITGDELSCDRLSQYRDTVDIVFDRNGVISTESSVDIGAILFTFGIYIQSCDVTLLADGMDFLCEVVDGELRVLVWCDCKNRIPAGKLAVVAISDDPVLTDVEVSDYYGNLMNVVMKTPF